jgi:hypothetical protein
MKLLLKQSFLLVTASLLLIPLASSILSPSASALSGSQFQADRIIDDAIFYNGNSMNSGEIQTFLNAKMPACDTNGTKMYNGSQTRAQWAAANGKPQPPYTCLKDFRQDHGAKSNSGLCDPISAQTNRTAAQIIDDVSRACKVSQKALIVMLQKEQSLVTDDWPWPVQYQKAMGYYCPDDPNNPGWCHPDYAGFFNQVYNAARQFNSYKLYPQDYNHAVGRTSFVAHQANAPHCSGTNLNMQNAATAGLYNYTPYQPNAAALNNLYGTGDACSAYGNRNFWRMFNDWFGTTKVVSLEGCHEATNTTRSCIWYLVSPTGEPFYTSQVNVRYYLVSAANYQYQSRIFFGNSVQLTGNVAVYRLEKPNGASFLTTNQTEYNALVGAGWAGHGIDFWADPGNTNTGYPVYRLYNPSNGQHRWTINTTEVYGLIDSGYTLESIPFTSISNVRQETAAPAGKELTYRFYIPQTHSHLWTNQLHERDTMILAGYQYEGVAWQTFSDTSKKPVFRLYAPSLQKHLYTVSGSERDALVVSGGYQYEGVSFYVSQSTTVNPVYRVYAPSLGKHHLTMDDNERNTLVGSGKWNDEGVAWYQP